MATSTKNSYECGVVRLNYSFHLHRQEDFDDFISPRPFTACPLSMAFYMHTYILIYCFIRHSTSIIRHSLTRLNIAISFDMIYFPPHSFKKLHPSFQFLASNVVCNHRRPRSSIPLLHLIKHKPCLLNGPTIDIHIDQRGTSINTRRPTTDT